MASGRISEKAEQYLRKLCLEIPTRRVGSRGNQSATDFFASVTAAFGFEIETPVFECMDWIQGGSQLTLGGACYESFVSPYSLGCQVRAPLVIASTVADLEAADISGKIVLLYGDIAKEQLMPKNFPFYNPDEHKRIITHLENQRPHAIIAATAWNPEMAGAIYPFPLIEDGDFDIPSVYMTEEEGYRLAEKAGEEATLNIQAQRKPATGCNVIARKGEQFSRSVVFCAHIDAKEGTPGATDNASGIVVLLLLAELLANYRGKLGIEIVALNGEDYYSNPGEQLYLSQNEGKFADIFLGINLDGVGYYQGKTAYSTYDCPPEIAESVEKIFSSRNELVEGEPWYQGDHSLFLMKGRPALALTSERVTELITQIAHTPKDRPEIIDAAKLGEIAFALRDLLLHLDQLQT